MRLEKDKEDSRSNIGIGDIKSSDLSINFDQELIDYDLRFDHYGTSEGNLDCLNELEIN